MIIYTDGSAHPNPGPGGYGVVVLTNDEYIACVRSRQTSQETTNNREELKAILWTMIEYGGAGLNPAPLVYSDSSYAVSTLNNWMFNWAKNGWIKSDKKTPENLDLIQTYYDLYQKGFRIDLRKVAGHAGIKWNELADQLATGKIAEEEALKIYG